MKIIVGLGNPGRKYEQTRHNAGFLAVDFFLKDKEVISCESKFNAKICEYHQDGSKIFFVKPESFMNLSGSVVQEICSFYKVDPKTDLLVIHDDKDLQFGIIKSTGSSGAAGHNGVQDIIDQLGTKEFSRIRIGVESREPDSPIPTDVFVLQKFSEDEMTKLTTTVLPEAISYINTFLN